MCCDPAEHDYFYPFCEPGGVSEIRLHDVNATVEEGMVDLFCIVRFMVVEHLGCFQNLASCGVHVHFFATVSRLIRSCFGSPFWFRRWNLRRSCRSCLLRTFIHITIKSLQGSRLQEDFAEGRLSRIEFTGAVADGCSATFSLQIR